MRQAQMMAELGSDDRLASLQGRGESIDLEELASAAEDNKVIRLLNLVLLQAIKDKASDIHCEPFEEEFKMRYRIDGILYEMMPPPAHIAPAIASRIKVMANLDIAERRLPQSSSEVSIPVHRHQRSPATLPFLCACLTQPPWRRACRRPPR